MPLLQAICKDLGQVVPATSSLISSTQDAAQQDDLLSWVFWPQPLCRIEDSPCNTQSIVSWLHNMSPLRLAASLPLRAPRHIESVRYVSCQIVKHPWVWVPALLLVNFSCLHSPVILLVSQLGPFSTFILCFQLWSLVVASSPLFSTSWLLISVIESLPRSHLRHFRLSLSLSQHRRNLLFSSQALFQTRDHSRVERALSAQHLNSTMTPDHCRIWNLRTLRTASFINKKGILLTKGNNSIRALCSTFNWVLCSYRR